MARQHDWAAIEADYRTGKYSNRELERIHKVSETAIRKKAKAGVWTKDLSKQVRQQTRAKAIQTSVTKRLKDKGQDTSKPLQDSQIVEAAAEMGAEIVTAHQLRIDRWQKVGDHFLTTMEDQMQAGKRVIEVASGAMEVDLDLEYIGKSLNQGTSALERLVRLERQAHGLDEEADTTAGQTLQELLSKVAPDDCGD